MATSLKRRYSDDLGAADEHTTHRPPIAHDTPQALQQPSQLAHLAHELLLQILTPLLTRSSPIILLPKSRSPKPSSRCSPLLSILLSCRSLYFAGIDAFYSSNTFHFFEAIHLRKLITTRLRHDQLQSVVSIQLDVAWRRGRRAEGSPWGLLHDCDACGQWRDVVEGLPRLSKVVVRNVTDFEGADLRDKVDREAWEGKMRAEMGDEKAGLLTFTWPSPF